jgi:iron complex transport system substrate-binding protein
MKKRVLSLLSATTEIVYALGCEDLLVGRSHECDYPESIFNLPVCTRPKFDVDGSSKEVNNKVNSILQNALSLYNIDEKLLKKLKPDIILTQSQCKVCAVSEKDVIEVVKNIVGVAPLIISVEPKCLEDIYKDIITISEALEIKRRGIGLVNSLKMRMEKIKMVVNSERVPTVAAIEWIDPLMAAGNWVPELISMAGAKNLFGETGKHSPWMQYNDLLKEDPEIIIIMPCGYDIQKSVIEIKALSKKKHWKEIKAVKNDNVYITDGNQYFNRAGPRLVESLEILVEILNFKESNFRHNNTGWIKFLTIN